MHKLMKKLILKSTPRANSLVLDGLGMSEMQRPEKCLLEILRAGAESFPKEVTFDDVKVCTPKEAAEFTIRMRSNKSSASAATSDLILVKTLFSLNGQQQPPKYMHLPVVGPGGRFFLGGSEKIVVPISTTPIITGDAEKGEVFIRLLKDKIRLVRSAYAIRKNDTIIGVNILHGKIHKTRAFCVRKNSVFTTIVHYVLIDKGVKKALSDVGCTDWIMEDVTPGLAIPSKEGYHVYSSKGEAPSIAIYIAIDQMSDLVLKYVASIIYICSNSDNGNKETIQNAFSLKILLGEIIYKDKKGNFSYLSEAMDLHIESISHNVDMMTRKSLAKQSRDSNSELMRSFKDVKNFMSLLCLVTEKADDIIAYSVTNPSSSILDVKYTFYYDIIKRVNTMSYVMKQKSEKKGEEGLSEGDLRTILNQHMLTERIYAIVRDSPSVDTFRSAGDNSYLSGGINAASNVKVSGPYDPALVFDPEVMAIGSICAPSKTQLLAAGKINCYLNSGDQETALETIEHIRSIMEEDK